MEKLIKKISEKIKKTPCLQAYEDLFYIGNEVMQENPKLARRYLEPHSEFLEKAIQNARTDEEMSDLFELHQKVILSLAPHHFESFLLHIEKNRELSKSFYLPRREQLKPIVNALQDLEDDKLDLLGISLPPGVGKTSLAIFYLTWIAGRCPDEPSLTGSHSNAFVRGAYDECLRIFDHRGEYLWKEVFPSVSLANTNAKDCRIDLGERKRFETLEFTSIGTGNAGLYRASKLLYCDDLVSGIEVALNKERLDKLWEVYRTDLRQRKQGDHCKELHIATRWSTQDIIGRLEAEYGHSDRSRFIRISALNENDESAFHYKYGVGFDTAFYHDQRRIMDDASWKALYMNEPIERDGQLFSKEELRRYFELPDTEPDAIYSVCDTKDQGVDYCVMPIVYQYGENFFVEEIICDNGNPELVEAKLVNALYRHKVHLSQFESNSAGGRIAQKVQAELKAKGGKTKISTKYTTQHKETKILVNSPWVKEHCLFKDDSVIGKEYKTALNFLFSYTLAGRNKFDDVPDAFAQLADFVQSLHTARISVVKRIF